VLYWSRDRAVLTEDGGKYLVRAGRIVTFEGDPPKWISIIAFENMEKAPAVPGSAVLRDLRNVPSAANNGDKSESLIKLVEASDESEE
jgi:uncharacterized protein (DUF1330 family)